jgi:hypothetical protein
MTNFASMNGFWGFAGLALGMISTGGAAEFLSVAERPIILSPEIKEASGLAISPTDAEFMWVINDSGGTPDLHLVGADGADRGKVTVKGVKNIDWEDLASFKLDGKSYLLVADCGDNAAKRQSGLFHIIREPALPAAGKGLADTVTPAWQIEFCYAGGPRDCEAVSVDSQAGKILLISKRTNPPEIYELPLQASGKKRVLTAQLIGRTAVDSLGGSFIPFSNQPTGLDVSADGSLAAVITYHSVFIFLRVPGESWTETFSKMPTVLSPHRLAQAESIAFSRDGQTLFAISEGCHSAIARYRKD